MSWSQRPSPSVTFCNCKYLKLFSFIRMQHYSQNGRHSGPSYILNGWVSLAISQQVDTTAKFCVMRITINLIICRMTASKIQTKLLPLILMDVLRRHRFKGTLSFNLTSKFSFWYGSGPPETLFVHLLLKTFFINSFILKMIAKTMSFQE